MADNFTLDNDLLADIYVAADVVGRELSGFIPSVNMNAQSTQASKGDFVRASFTQAATAVDVTEHMTTPEAASATVDEKNLQLSKHRAVRYQIGGEDTRSMQNNNIYGTIYGDLVSQGMRQLCNEMEADLAAEIKQNASRATEDAGTTIFSGDDFNSIGEARKILVDNGAPSTDLQLVCDTRAGANLRNNTNLVQANTSGSIDVREQGILLPIFGMDVRESSQIGAHTIGTLAGSPLTDVTDAIGATSIAINGGTGSTTVVTGDVVQFGGAGDKYVVNTGTADGSSGTITLNNPGLVAAVANDTAIAVQANVSQAYAFHRRALELAMRAPAEPVGGDSAVDVTTVQDPRSGMVFQIRLYRGYHANMIEIGVVYGVKAWKSDFIATIFNDA